VATDAIDAIERHAFDAWPAEEVEHFEGWRLRAMRGVTRRANSAWVLDAAGARPISSRIEFTEAWYAARGLKASYQVTDHARNEGLDAALEARGYAIDAPVSIQVARAVAVAGGGAPTPDGVVVEVRRDLSEAWFTLSAHKGRFAKVADVYRGLLDRTGSAARFALARVEGEPAAVGLGVVANQAHETSRAPPWMGIFSMLTLPSFRRHGAARAVLVGLAQQAVDEGIPDLYLQVERDNAPALALYGAASFRELYGYHYRVRGE
jgi:GNAT superfamily N-acetyltransferase